MQGTEDLHSVSSPRRVLSFSKRRKATVSFLDPDDKAASGFGVSGDHGPKSSEVYGFVGSITTVVATGWIHLFFVPFFWNSEFIFLNAMKDFIY